MGVWDFHSNEMYGFWEAQIKARFEYYYRIETKKSLLYRFITWSWFSNPPREINETIIYVLYVRMSLFFYHLKCVWGKCKIIWVKERNREKITQVGKRPWCSSLGHTLTMIWARHTLSHTHTQTHIQLWHACCIIYFDWRFSYSDRWIKWEKKITSQFH